MNDIKGGTVIVIGIVALVAGFFIAVAMMPKQIVNEDKIFSQADLDQALTSKNTQIETLRGLIEKQNVTETEKDKEEEIVEPKIIGYLIDDISLNSTFGKALSDREINVFDGKVEFDDKDYDAEEVVNLSNLKIAINNKDFKDNAYLQILKDELSYRMDFESDLNTSEISEDETLKFNFLGQPVAISKWDENEITFFKGTEKLVKKDEAVKFGDYTILLVTVSDESAFVSVTKGDITNSKIINKDETKKVNGLKIKVEDVFSNPTNSFAELVYGKEIKEEVKNGKEYIKNGIWDWVITSKESGDDTNSIGIVLNEDFKELENREGYNVLDVNDELCLPNDYVCVKYNGLTNESMDKYSFELDNGIIFIDGNFNLGLESYDKLFVNTTNGYIFKDRHDVNDANLSITKDILLGDSDLKLLHNLTTISIEELSFNFNETSLSNLFVDSESISTEDDSYRSIYGTIVYSPKDNLENNKIRISVPEKKLEGSISIK